MPQFDLSVIKTFTISGDAVNLYAMIDGGIVASAKQGLTVPQQAVVESYRWVPTTIQLQGDPLAIPPTAGVCPAWAGADPAPVYFKATAAQIQAALVKWYK